MASTPSNPPTGATNAPLDEHDALPRGTRFGELEILRVLGIGGFGIVYLAQDHSLQRQVALKEYMPSSLAGRGKGQMVSVRSGAHTETYALGLRSFVNEARLLARFNHPSLVKVYRFWEENGTAYMVMPFLQGRTLRDVRRSMSIAPSQEWIRSVVDPMLDALDLLHREGVYHRDIAPDNIFLPPGELPVLLDFGAARRAIGDSTQTFTAILKPSYAPIEQYAEVVQLRQGPWTDLYALGAVTYYLIRGVPPPPATARAVQDDERLLPPEANPGFSPPFLSAIEWALEIRPANRPQSIAALRDVIEGRADAPARSHPGTTTPNRTIVAQAPADSDFAATMPADFTQGDPGAMEATRPMTVPPVWTTPPARPYRAPVADPATQPDAAMFTRTRPETTAMPTRPTMDTPPSGKRKLGVWAAAAVGAVVAVGATAAWLGGGRGSSADGTSPSAAASAPADTAASPTPNAPKTATSIAATVSPATDASAKSNNIAATADRSRMSSAEKAAAASAAPVVAMFASAPQTTPAAAHARGKDKLARPDAASATAHVDEARVDHRRSPVREDGAHVQGGTAPQPVPAAAVPTQAVQPGPSTPREACGSRVFLALALCMEEQCERPRFKSHPQCTKVHEMIERRRRGESGG